ACIFFFVIPLRAASSVSRERERRTLDSLLMTPLRPREILFAKWLGCILCAFPMFWGLFLVVAFGLITGFLHVLAGLLLIVACVIYACLLACIGLWNSLWCRSTLHASVLTAFITVSLGGGPALLAFNTGDLFLTHFSAEFAGWLERFLIYGLTP